MAEADQSITHEIMNSITPLHLCHPHSIMLKGMVALIKMKNCRSQRIGNEIQEALQNHHKRSQVTPLWNTYRNLYQNSPS